MEELEAQAITLFRDYMQRAESLLKDVELVESYAKGA
jgi:hypothetical protein